MKKEYWIHISFENQEHKEFRVDSHVPFIIDCFEEYRFGQQTTIINKLKVNYINKFTIIFDENNEIIQFPI